MNYRSLRARWCLSLGLALAVLSTPAAAGNELDCFGEDYNRRIAGCSAIIDSGALTGRDLALAYAARALAHSVQGRYQMAIPDYDESLRLDGSSAIALNNRAWAYYKSGEPERGAGDVEKALALLPDSPHTLDTRAHIRQSRGDITGALRDYERAMRVGGEHIVKLYQCGLQASGAYKGEIDGLLTTDVRKALESCVATTGCDPLPAEEECRKVTS